MPPHSKLRRICAQIAASYYTCICLYYYSLYAFSFTLLEMFYALAAHWNYGHFRTKHISVESCSRCWITYLAGEQNEMEMIEIFHSQVNDKGIGIFYFAAPICEMRWKLASRKKNHFIFFTAPPITSRMALIRSNKNMNIQFSTFGKMSKIIIVISGSGPVHWIYIAFGSWMKQHLMRRTQKHFLK